MTNINKENRNSTKLSKASTYLSGEENELVFRLIGKRCQSQATTVAQLYQADHYRWVKKFTGVLCFVKDNSKRSYYARMFCLIKHEMIWEQEMYDTINILKPQPYLITFEGQDSIIGLNFAFEDEANIFYEIATNTVISRNRRREERRNRIKKEPPARPPPITVKSATKTDDVVTLRNPANIAKLSVQQSNFSKNKKRDSSKKLTKADIGTPSNFKHVTHVGWNAKSGFDLSGEDENLRPFLQKAGVSENQLKDRQTRAFIYDFIQSNNVEEIVRKETKKPAAPPVPSRHQNQGNEKNLHRIAPPPPPLPPQRDYNLIATNKETHSLSNSSLAILSEKSVPIKDAPLQSNINSAPAAPPPPPPLPPPSESSINNTAPPLKVNASTASSTPVMAVPVNDARTALMESIRKGAQLKKVDKTTIQNSTDSRNDLLTEIREGIELRPVNHNRSGDLANSSGTDALADALRRALEQRKMAINGDSSSESGNDNSDDNEWSD